MPEYKRKTPARVDSENMRKDIGEEKTTSGNPVGNPSEPSRNQMKTGAIIGDGDRKRALFLVLGLAP